MVALCVLTGRDWSAAAEPRRPIKATFAAVRSVTLALVYVQVVAGAWLRHYGTLAALVVHALLAAAVWGHAALLAWRVERSQAEVPASARFGPRAGGGWSPCRSALGTAAWWLLRPFDGIPRRVRPAQALIRTAHQANGALLLAAAVVLTMRAMRHLGSGRRPVGPCRPAPPIDREILA